MIKNKNIIIVLIAVITMAIFIQILRSDYLFGLTSENYEEAYSAEDMKYLSKQELSHVPDNKYLLLINSSKVGTDEESPEIERRLKENVCQTLDYIKRDYEIYDLANSTGKSLDFPKYQMVIVALYDLSSFNELDKLCEYVSNGGRVVFAYPLERNDSFYNIYRKLGIDEAEECRIVSGLNLKDNILLQGSGMKFSGQAIFNNYSGIVSLNKNCRVHATSDDNIPLIWDVDYGKGKFLIFNISMTTEKYCRGLLVGGMSYIEEDMIYPILNSKMVFIDDFPAPFTTQEDKQLMKDYGRNNRDFFRDVWWSDMQKTAISYDIKYTALVIENYEQSIEDKNITQSNQMLITYGRELINMGGELGIHGYNHQPLALEGFIKDAELGYKPWNSIEEMKEGLSMLSQFIKSAFPNYDIQTYVPPSNILSSEGRIALKQAIPSITSIASVNSKLDDDDQYEQEFRIEDDGIASLPRTTSGYDNNQVNVLTAMDGVTGLGIISHFVHPDDVLDNTRNGGESWDKMYRKYCDFLDILTHKYSWVRPLTAAQTTYELKKYQNSKIYFKKDGNSITGYCSGFKDAMFFILRSSKKVTAKDQCLVKNIDKNIYLIEAKDYKFTINLGG